MRRHTPHALLAVLVAAVFGATVWAAVATAEEKKTAKERVTEPLRREHRELLPHIEALASAGDAIGVAGQGEQRAKVHASYTFLKRQLIPHAVAEDKVLYAKVDKLIGASGSTRATDTMRRDHVEVGRLTDKLGKLGERLHEGTLTSAQQRELRRTLYALHGIVSLHFAKEEEVYLPLLDRKLTAAEAERMFEQMEKATAKAGADDHSH